jgi:indole-3-glycerol phosphate synthase
MPDFFDVLCRTAQKTVATGYYSMFGQCDTPPRASSPLRLSDSITRCAHVPVIAEIKIASPTKGPMRVRTDSGAVAEQMEAGGAVGISVVTEPRFFKGSPRLLENARSRVSVPILMKDFVVSASQIEAARDAGATAVLLIQSLFDRGYAKRGVEEMIDVAHAIGLEVLLEANSASEFEHATSTGADLLGINNRDLGTLNVDLMTTKKILEKVPVNGRIIVSESGITTSKNALFLRRCGADALLVGSALMRAQDILRAVSRLVRAS